MNLIFLLLFALPVQAEVISLPSALENATDRNFKNIDEEVERIDLTNGGVVEGSLTFNSGSTVTFSSSVVFLNVEVTISTSLVVSGDIKGTTITFTTLLQVCPSGFNAVQSTKSAHAPVLGCIEQARQSAARYDDALMECFQNHGGTFPTVTMYQLAARLGIIDNATGAFQWVDDFESGNARIIVGNSSVFNTSAAQVTTSHAYRCWVER